LFKRKGITIYHPFLGGCLEGRVVLWRLGEASTWSMAIAVKQPGRLLVAHVLNPTE